MIPAAADSITMILPVNPDQNREKTLRSGRVPGWGYPVTAARSGAVSGQIPSNMSVLESDEYLSMPYRSSLQVCVTDSCMYL